MHIRAYLFMLAAGILLPVMLFSTVALRLLQHAEKEAALGGLREMANGLALLVDRELYSAEAALHVLAASPSLAAHDHAAFYRQAMQWQAGRDGWIALLDADGKVLLSTAVPFGAAPGSLPGVRELVDGGKTGVSDLFTGAPDGKLWAAVAVPVKLADGRGYVVAKTFSTDHFVALTQGARVPPGWLAAIVDGKGRVLARNLNAQRVVGAAERPELMAAMRLARGGTLAGRSLEGTPIVDVYTRPSMSNWTVSAAAPVALLERSSRDASLLAAGGLALATLAAIALAAWLGRLHVRSMARVLQSAIDLGNGIAPLPARSRVAEVHALHAALHAAGEQLLQAHAWRRHAESERQSLLEGEQKARALAEQQNTAKDQFLAMLGHELRNPLAPISTAAQLLRLQSPDAARVRYASDVISRQVEHMNSLLGDLLDVSRVTRGLVTLTIEAVELKTVIERALEQTSNLITQKQHQVGLDLPDGPLLVKGDKTRLIQIFANLINNAARYTPAGGHIWIAARSGAGQLTVTVDDNGEGFDEALLPHIFDLFSQGERTPDRSQGGLGLGLALVQSLVKLHGGSVSACSAGPGEGSNFTVTLPYSEPAGARAASTFSEGHAEKLRIMIVDDNIDGAISLSLFLEEAGGHRVSTYYDGGSALASAAAEAPDVFILDIGLPDITGYELVRRLQALPQCARALYIALTGYGQPQDKEQAYAAGFRHHVAKPADPKLILGLVGEAIRLP